MKSSVGSFSKGNHWVSIRSAGSGIGMGGRQNGKPDEQKSLAQNGGYNGHSRYSRMMSTRPSWYSSDERFKDRSRWEAWWFAKQGGCQCAHKESVSVHTRRVSVCTAGRMAVCTAGRVEVCTVGGVGVCTAGRVTLCITEGAGAP